MAANLGAKVVISKNDGTSYVTVAMGKSSSLKFNNKLADITTGLDEEYISGIRACEFSFEGVFLDDAQSVGFLTDLQSGNEQDLKITFLSGFEVQANFLAESFEVKMDNTSAVTFSVSFKANGVVTLNNIPV